MTDLPTLHDRLQGLKGPCRETDAMIAVAFQYAGQDDLRGPQAPLGYGKWIQGDGPDNGAPWPDRIYATDDFGNVVVRQAPEFLLCLTSSLTLCEYVLDSPRCVITTGYLPSAEVGCEHGKFLARADSPEQALLIALTAAMMKKEKADG